MSIVQQCAFKLPVWVNPWLAKAPQQFNSYNQGMAFAISLAAENIRRGSGGPFGAVVINTAANELVSVGVNLVTASGLSIAHAEMVALSLAQARLGNWNLSSAGNLTLVTTCEPCAMCYGAVPWSGIRTLVCGARKSDAEAAGFDEGAKPGNWRQALRDRGIELHQDVLRTSAADLFRLYAERGGEIYNADQDGQI